MPSGGKPKQYPSDQVGTVQALYVAGMTQAEIACHLGLTQKVIWNLMRRHGINARVAAKRDQAGQRNSSWRGSEASYTALHKRVEVARGRALQCDRCGTCDPHRTYEWANLTGAYDDVDDYQRMCRHCHRRYDKARRGGDA